MPWARSRSLLFSLLETAPRIVCRMPASASMKQLRVEPVPTPTMLSATTYSRAARPTSAFSSSWVFGGDLIPGLSTPAPQLRPDPGIELLPAEPAGGERSLAQARSFLVRLLRDLRRLVVADVRVQRRHEHQRALHQFVDARRVRFDAARAVLLEAARTVGQQANALQQVVDDHRLEHVQLEVARRTGQVDRHVVAEHLAAQHRQRFALGRVDLARHDPAAWLVLRDRDLAEPRA